CRTAHVRYLLWIELDTTISRQRLGGKNSRILPPSVEILPNTHLIGARFRAHILTAEGPPRTRGSGRGRPAARRIPSRARRAGRRTPYRGGTGARANIPVGEKEEPKDEARAGRGTARNGPSRGRSGAPLHRGRSAHAC